MNIIRADPFNVGHTTQTFLSINDNLKYTFESLQNCAFGKEVYIAL